MEGAPVERQSKTVSLSDEVAAVGKLDPKEEAEILSINANTWARLVMVLVIAGIFIGLNWAVMSLVRHAYAQDLEMMKMPGAIFRPEHRVVTTEVFISLIGATVVQVGIAIVAIVSYLFPKKAG
jgi:hypothetical protein